MKNKKIVIIFSVLLIILIIGGYFVIKYLKQKDESGEIAEEYTPQEEISEEQLRQTIVTLYFISKDTKEITPEARLVDIKDIITNPYENLINLLIEGPKNEKNQKVIPDNTKLNKTYMEGDCITLDFSQEFLNYDKNDEKAKENMINSIVNTLTELTEVNKVKILIDGNQSEEFQEEYQRITK